MEANELLAPFIFAAYKEKKRKNKLKEEHRFHASYQRMTCTMRGGRERGKKGLEEKGKGLTATDIALFRKVRKKRKRGKKKKKRKRGGVRRGRGRWWPILAAPRAA